MSIGSLGSATSLFSLRSIERPKVRLSEAVPSLGPGSLVGDKYHLVKRRAVGRRSVVWDAIHVDLHRPCVLKIFDADPMSPAIAADIRRTASLAHPNVMSIHDVFVVPPANVYAVAMPRLDGHCLHHLVAAHGPLEERGAARLFVQIAEAVAHAHERGVIFPEVGMSSIFVTAPLPHDLERPGVKILGIVEPFARFAALAEVERRIVRDLAQLYRECAGETTGRLARLLASRTGSRPSLRDVQRTFIEIATEDRRQ